MYRIVLLVLATGVLAAPVSGARPTAKAFEGDRGAALLPHCLERKSSS
jgi:hypothetical protein